MGHIYTERKKSIAVGQNMPKTAENISKSDMLRMSGAGAPQPMSASLREKFEPGFGADFSNIRISRGHSPEEMGVQAVAKGTDILVDSRAGMDVLGHELAHVVQQAQGRVEGGYPVVENAALEHEADVMGARVASGMNAEMGGLSGMGGEMMSIVPMSNASAPAQCKSKEEKAAEKQAEKDQQALAAAQAQRDADPRVQAQRAAIQEEVGRVAEMREAAKTSAAVFGKSVRVDHIMDERNGVQNWEVPNKVEHNLQDFMIQMQVDPGAMAMLKKQTARAKEQNLAGDGGDAAMYALEDMYRNVYMHAAKNEMENSENPLDVGVDHNRALLLGDQLERMKNGGDDDYHDAWYGGNTNGRLAKENRYWVKRFLRGNSL